MNLFRNIFRLHSKLETNAGTRNTETLSSNRLKEKEFLSVKELAGILGIGQNSAYKLTKTDSFPCMRLGYRILIPRNKFDNWVEWKIEKSKNTNRIRKEN
jgi:excisionase family DNA binding protein